MTTFTSNNEAKKVAEQIAKTIQVFFTNEGLEILFTSEDRNQKEIADELKSVFSDVKIKGRKGRIKGAKLFRSGRMIFFCIQFEL